MTLIKIDGNSPSLLHQSRKTTVHGNSSKNRTGKILAQSESNKNYKIWHKKGISLQKDSMNHVMRLVRDDAMGQTSLN